MGLSLISFIRHGLTDKMSTNLKNNIAGTKNFIQNHKKALIITGVVLAVAIIGLTLLILHPPAFLAAALTTKKVLVVNPHIWPVCRLPSPPICPMPFPVLKIPTVLF